MEEISQNIAKNIINLRKFYKMTQQDLANKINFSDKAISKWERAEATPDIETLYKISKVFDVNIDYLIQEHQSNEINKFNKNKNLFIRNLLILIMLCVSVIFLATVIFIFSILRNVDYAKTVWVAYVFTLPICSLICYFYAKKNDFKLMKLITISLFVWTIITSLFCIALVIQIKSVWMLYIVGVPIQAAICLFHFWKKTF